MSHAEWPDWLDDLVERVRFSPGDEDWWESPEAVLGEGQSDRTMHFLAVLGLAELVIQVHRMERTRLASCAGDELAESRMRSFGYPVNDDQCQNGDE